MKHVWNSIKPYGLWEAHPSAALWGVFWKSSQLDRRIHFPIYLNEKIARAFLQSLLANIWPWLKMNLHSCYELYLGMLPLPMEKCGNLIIQYRKVFQLICASKTLGHGFGMFSRRWIKTILFDIHLQFSVAQLHHICIQPTGSVLGKENPGWATGSRGVELAALTHLSPLSPQPVPRGARCCCGGALRGGGGAQIRHKTEAVAICGH